jgi:hypothetical protein
VPIGTAPVGQSVCSVEPSSFYAPSCSIGTQADTCCNLEQGHLLVTFCASLFGCLSGAPVRRQSFRSVARADLRHGRSPSVWNAGSGSSGPADSWTGHGLWPDRCDGSYDAYCDPSQEVANVTAVLESYGQTELLDYMNEFWIGNNGNEDLWSHETNKHGTCISTIKKACYTNYYPQAEIVTYFQRTTEFFKALPSYDWLAEAGIVPSVDKTYTLAEITSVLEAKHGGGVNVNCGKGGVLSELWYHYASQGSLIDGDIVPVPLVGSGSTCPATGIKVRATCCRR